MAASTPAPRDDLIALQRRGITWTLGGGHPMLPVTRAARRAAVLVLFGVLDGDASESVGPSPDELDVLLLRRAATLGTHPGQIAFPGGRLEDDEDATAAAIREAVEETGLDPTGVEVLGILPDAPLMVSDHLVTPVLGWWTKPSQVAAINAAETVDVFRVPLAKLLDPRNRMTGIAARGDRTFRAPAFRVGDVQVWGFTAILLATLFDELGWSVPWDVTRTVDL